MDALKNRLYFSLLIVFCCLLGGIIYLADSNAPGRATLPENTNKEWYTYDRDRGGLPDVKATVGEPRGDNARDRMAYEVRKLVDPKTGLVPSGMRQRELARVASLPRRDAVVQKNGTVATWSARGPFNVGGRTRALAIDRGFNGSSNQRILAGGVSGGVFLSEDDGATWRLTSDLDGLASVTAIAQDPVNRNVWYYGTGESLGNSASNGGGATYLGQGIFKSTDGGESWAQLPATITNNSANVFDSIFDVVWNVAVHPSNGNVYAAVFGLIMVSQDGGDSWFVSLGSTDPPFSAATDIAIASNGTLYATLSRSGQNVNVFGVFQSTDGGVNWTNITPPGYGPDPYRQVLGVSPSNPNIVYLLTQSNPSGARASDHEFYRFDASNGQWTTLSSNLPNVTTPDPRGNQPVDGINSFNSQGGYDLLVQVKPDDPNTVWVGGNSLYRSTNGGLSFEQVGGYESPYSLALYERHHPDQHSMSFYPNDPSAMISGHDGGLSKTTNAMASPQTWSSLNNGYLTSQFYTVAIDPEPGSDFVIGGLQDNGTWSTNSTNSDVPWFSEFSGDGSFTAIAPGGLPYYVSAQQGFIARFSLSDNRLVGSVVAPAGGQDYLFIAPYLLDPNDARVMYLAEGNRVWRNSNLDQIPANNGRTTQINWTPLTGASVPSTRFVTSLDVSKTPANRLVFGATNFQTTTRIIRVDNPQSNGAGTDITPPGAVQGSYPAGIDMNPENADEIIVVFSNYNVPSIWYSTDGGANWLNVDGNLGGADGPSIAWPLIMPTSGGTQYYVATSTGVYSTETLAGNNTVWAQEGADVIGNVDADMIIGRPEDGVIVAATHGRGVYSATLDGTSGSAVLASTTNRVELSAQPGEIARGTVEIQNVGDVKLRYTIALSDVTNTSVASTRPALTNALRLDGEPALQRPSFSAKKSSSAGISGDKTILQNASAPVVLAGTDVLTYDDGNDTADDFWGFLDPGISLFWGNDFLADGFDYQLEDIQFYMRTEDADTNSVQITVYDQEGSALVAGEIIFDIAPLGDWFTATITPPIMIPQGESFFVEIGASSDIQFPAGIDSDAQVTGRSFFGNQGSEFALSDQTGSGFENGAFLVRVIGTISQGANLPPEVVGLVSTFEAAVGEDITFDASESTDPDGQIVSYLWAFGDGNTSDQAVTTYAYSNPGTYAVSITVTDDGGAQDVAAGEIVVMGAANQAPVAVISASATEADVLETISFDGTGSFDADGSIAAYTWNFGDGTERSGDTVTHAYTSTGTYNVTLSVTDNNGASSQSVEQVRVISSIARLGVVPLEGTMAPGDSEILNISFNTEGLVVGTYEGSITVSSVGGTVQIPVTVLVSNTVSVADDVGRVTETMLAPNYPNPFTGTTTIRYELPGDARVALEVFDVNGRQVQSIDDGFRAAGMHEVRWDATDRAGNAVSSGIYMYRLTVYGSGGDISHHTGKMTFIR